MSLGSVLGVLLEKRVDRKFVDDSAGGCWTIDRDKAFQNRMLRQ